MEIGTLASYSVASSVTDSEAGVTFGTNRPSDQSVQGEPQTGGSMSLWIIIIVAAGTVSLLATIAVSYFAYSRGPRM